MKSKNLNEYLDTLAECIKPVVDAIHEQIPITKGYYGEYMSAISMVALKSDAESGEASNKVKLGIGVAFIRAGANRDGVMSALHAMGVI